MATRIHKFSGSLILAKYLSENDLNKSREITFQVTCQMKIEYYYEFLKLDHERASCELVIGLALGERVVAGGGAGSGRGRLRAVAQRVKHAQNEPPSSTQPPLHVTCNNFINLLDCLKVIASSQVRASVGGGILKPNG